MTAKSTTLASQERLLNHVFAGANFSSAYLAWLYEGGPDGRHIPSDYVEADELLGHYTVVPQTWRSGSNVYPLALSLNTAVHQRARGKGLFTKLAEESYATAKSQGIKAIIGVANANSTPGFLKRLGFVLIRPLPVVAGAVFPTFGRAATSRRVTADFLTSSDFIAIARAVQQGQPTAEWVQNWTADKLRWRLSNPRADYALHSDSTGTLLTTTAPLTAGVRAVIALKFLPHAPHEPVDTKTLLRKAAGFHRSPFFIYSGFNDHAPVRGLPLPRRLLPSPLNLIYRRLDESMPSPEHVRFSTFEFLDFDAY